MLPGRSHHNAYRGKTMTATAASWAMSMLVVMVVMVVMAVMVAADHMLAEEPAPSAVTVSAVDFLRDIKPIFVRHCYECHGPGQERGGLSLAARGLALSGGDNGPAVLPGSADTSLLLHRVTGQKAPAMTLDG
jgi:mono/diheme cytochrome c family protein